MIIFTEEDRQMLKHVADVIGDRMHSEDGYSDRDYATMGKLNALTESPTSSLVITGDGADSDGQQLFQTIMRAELAHWVPNASQRLLYRAGRLLGVQQPNPATGRPECGEHAHALNSEWIVGIYVRRCVHCFRLLEG